MSNLNSINATKLQHKTRFSTQEFTHSDHSNSSETWYQTSYRCYQAAHVVSKNLNLKWERILKMKLWVKEN